MTKSYDISDSETVPIIMNWLGHEGFHFVETLMNVSKQHVKSVQAFFDILYAEFKPQHNKTMLSLQNCKLSMDE